MPLSISEFSFFSFNFYPEMVYFVYLFISSPPLYLICFITCTLTSRPCLTFLFCRKKVKSGIFTYFSKSLLSRSHVSESEIMSKGHWRKHNSKPVYTYMYIHIHMNLFHVNIRIKFPIFFGVVKTSLLNGKF